MSGLSQTEEESIDSRNNMKEHRYWTQEEVFEPLTEEQMKAEQEHRKRLQEKHDKSKIDLWESVS